MFFSYATGYSSSSSSSGSNHPDNGDGDQFRRQHRPSSSSAGTASGSTLQFNLNDTINNLNSVGKNLVDSMNDSLDGFRRNISDMNRMFNASTNSKNECNSCGRCFGLISLHRKKCGKCSLTYCCDCMSILSTSGPTPSDKICKRCRVFANRPLRRDDVNGLKVRDLKWYLACKHNFDSRHFTEKYELVAVIMSLDRAEGSRSDDQNQHQPHSAYDSGSQPTAPSSQPQQSTPNPCSQTHSASSKRNGTCGGQKSDTIELDDIGNEDEIQALTVKQLKYLLIKNYVDFRGCLERQEFVQKVVLLYRDKKNNDALKEQIETGSASVPHSGGVDENQCKICWEKVVDCVLLDCGHMSTCLDCGRKLSECPICRQYIVRVVRVFKA